MAPTILHFMSTIAKAVFRSLLLDNVSEMLHVLTLEVSNFVGYLANGEAARRWSFYGMYRAFHGIVLSNSKERMLQ
jgi:hypothetical protein